MPEIPSVGWEPQVLQDLIRDLSALRDEMTLAETGFSEEIAQVHRNHAPGARNLVHYLALRRRDARAIQQRLARIGVSSLGRAESHVLANLDKALGIVHRLAGQEWSPRSSDEPAGYVRGRDFLARHANDLFGAAPQQRGVRILVTLPPEAAGDYELVRGMVNAGMDAARINCAHDDSRTWTAMAQNVRRAAAESKRDCRILMDLGGPKLRTGPIAPLRAVLKWRPKRDPFGMVLAPAVVWLHAAGMSAAPPASAREAAILGVEAQWLAQLRAGDVATFSDARGRSRVLRIFRVLKRGVLARCDRTAYVTTETLLTLKGRRRVRSTWVADLPQTPQRIVLKRGDRLLLTSGGLGRPASVTREGRVTAKASIPCTLPEVYAQVKPGQRIWLDDGRIGGVVRRANRKQLEVEITYGGAGDAGQRLGADKGINFPDSALALPALTPSDAEDLAHVVKLADLVGLSFVQRASDIDDLRARLAALGKPQMGIVLKIETRFAFENLPALLLAAMRSPVAGVMIARGDLAVECGYERLAEIQEEILWLAEAAHLPAIWATQVLETLAKRGQPSRAEITDAAMGVRAECVMLNKGPHVLDAIRALGGILQRMQTHQSKKQPLLRELRSWRSAAV